MPNQRIKFLSRLDRLESHLVKESDFDGKIKAELPAHWLPSMKDDTPLILDLSDIAKEYDLGRKCLKAILSQPGWTIRILTKNAAVTGQTGLLKKELEILAANGDQKRERGMPKKLNSKNFIILREYCVKENPIN